MARIESVAIGGYYPTPTHLLPRIAGRIGALPEKRYAFLDPCAGDGEAVSTLVDCLCPRPERENRDFYKPNRGPRVYAVELEGKRAEALERRMDDRWSGPNEVLHGDAFRVTWTPSKLYTGVSCLYLNPPYDLHPTYGRLEEKFLVRYTPALVESGVLVFVVPVHALAASANTLAREYATMRCFRFPEADYAAYKQVVVYARKRAKALLAADPALLAKVEQWVSKPESIPELTEQAKALGDLPSPPFKADKYSTEPEAGLADFKLQPVDLATVMAAYQPWGMSARNGAVSPIPGVYVDPTSDDLMTRTYPTALPPRPAHVAAGIASGVFNGRRIFPTDPDSKAPPLLVKGVFDREFETVEEKTNALGEVTGLVQVQQPRLVVTALDLSTSKLHTIVSQVDLTGSTDPATMTTGDLLTVYGGSLLEALKAQCPVIHDPGNPEHAFELPAIERPLYEAQANAARAGLRLLGGPNVPLRRRQRKAAIVLGEIGSGKTGVSFSIALGCNGSKILTLCPPHLLTTWEDEVKTLRPDATIHVLNTVADVDAFNALKPATVAVAVLSRETAKLGHAWAGVSKVCPRCGGPLEVSAEEAARKRLRCEHRQLLPLDVPTSIMRDLGALLMSYMPDAPIVAQAARLSPVAHKMLPKFLKRRQGTKDNPIPKGLSIAETEHLRALPAIRALVWKLAAQLLEEPAHWDGPSPGMVSALKHLCAFLNDDVLTSELAERLYCTSAYWQDSYRGRHIRSIARLLVAQMANGSKLQTVTMERLHAVSGEVPRDSYHDGRDVQSLRELTVKLSAFNHDAGSGISHRDPLSKVLGKLQLGGVEVGHADHLERAVAKLWEAAKVTAGETCGEPLFQAIPEPARYPLALYISRRYPRFADVLIVDEGHEYGSDGSAQERACHRLTNMGWPIVMLTGSVMNGYAESLFANWWALFGSFRQEFAHNERTRFRDRYGYRKRLVQDVDKKGGVVAFGSHSDRVERREKDLGNAPGLLPLFILQHLLPNCVTIQKADLKLDLPPCIEIPVRVTPSEVQYTRHMDMLGELFQQVRQDAFTPLAGKLWGQVAEAPSQLDRATQDTGNCPTGAYEVRYPESVGHGLVCAVEPEPAESILPKEAWMLDLVAAELAEGRNVILFSWHTELLPRLQRLVEARFGFKAPILVPEKVPSGKRKEWINKHVLAKGARVMLTNPMCVQTGLNNLVHFCTQVWMENPACNPIIYRQAIGRADRIGQTREVRIYFPIYEVLTQTKLHSLLFHKVGVSMATDGLDAESALQAAGVGESGNVTSFSVGKELYKLLEGQW